MAQNLLLQGNPLSRPLDDEAAGFEAKLRAMPSYELKAEYIVRTGKKWDDLPRPRLENAILALMQHLRTGSCPE